MNFKIRSDRFPREMIRTLGILQKAVVLTSYEPGPPKEKSDLIIRVADQMICVAILNPHIGTDNTTKVAKSPLTMAVLSARRRSSRA